MTVFASSKSAVGSRHGGFALDQTNAPLIQLTDTNVSCIVGQFPWGPDGEVVTPSSPKDRLNKFAPFGMDHAGTGYLSFISASWPDLRAVRAIGPTAAAAGVFLLDGSSNTIAAVAAKYKGAAGNSIVVFVTDATDGNPLHFDLTVVVSGTGGSTTDEIKNLNYSGTGADSVVDTTNAVLVGIVAGGVSGGAVAGRPVNGTFTMLGGLDGSVTSAEYVGTSGTGDKGLALCEGDEEIRQVFIDDCGNTIRNAVNAGLLQHAETMGDRVAFIAGDDGLTLAQTQTDVGNFRSTRVVYMDPWVIVRDDVDGSQHHMPPGCFGASMSAQLPPSTSIAWKGAEAGSMLNRIVSTVPGGERGSARSSNTDAGIATIFKHPLGGYRVEADPVTYAPVNPLKKSLRRTRVGDLIATSFVNSVQDQVDAPNVTTTQQSILNALSSLLADLKQAQDRDPIHNAFIKDYSVPFVASTPEEIQAGELEIDVDVEVGSAAERIFLGINYGEGVSVQAT